MKISKKTFVLSVYVLLVVLAAAIMGWVIFQSNKMWEDSSTWYTEHKLILPQVAKDLNVSLVGDMGKGEFSFSAPYCMLYEIKQTESSATLKCSLLPFYYTVRQAEVPKDWSENSDIALVITKEDAEPQDFLGRLDKSYTSVSSLGSSIHPVSLSVQGSIIKPQASFLGKLEHLRKVYAKEKDQFIVSISSYKVSKLDNLTNAQKAEYAKKWKVAVDKELSDYVKITETKKPISQPFLSIMREAFAFERLKCSDLEKCEYSYKKNPAEKFMYSVYNWESSNKEAFLQAKGAMLTSLFPFYDVRKGTPEEVISEDRLPGWNELAAYTFPICPINDVVGGTTSQSSALFLLYMNKNLASNLQSLTSQKEVIASIDAQFKLVDFVKTGKWGSDLISNVNVGCYYLLVNGVTENQLLKKKVIDTYFSMLSMSIGKKVEPTAISMNTLIYESTAYSPYKTSFISDQSISRLRETSLESSVKAADAYTEWRSLLHTTVVLYLTNGTY